MNLRRDMIAGVIGLALLTIPMTVSAADNDNSPNRNQNQSHERAQAPAAHEQARPAARPPTSKPEQAGREQRAPEKASRSVEQKNLSTNQSRERETHTARSAPLEANRPQANNEEHRDQRGWHGDHGDHDNGTYAAAGPIWVMPEGYAGGPCAWAHHLRELIDEDRATGHYGAADDLVPRFHEAERRCHG
jgi:hypothetical protein